MDFRKQKNMRLLDTEFGQVLVVKGTDDNGEECIEVSMNLEMESMYVTPKVTFSFDNSDKRDEAFNRDLELADIAGNMLDAVELSLKG